MAGRDLEDASPGALLKERFGGAGLASPTLFKVIGFGGLIIRERPGNSTARTPSTLEDGEIFQVDRIVTVTAQSGKTIDWSERPTDVACFLHLADGRGWVGDTHPQTEDPVVEAYDPDAAGAQRLRRELRPFFRSKRYEIGIGIIILLNAATIGLEIDHPHAIDTEILLLVNGAFLLIYLAEVGLKLFAFSGAFFFSSWNLFDLTVTLVTMVSDGVFFYYYFRSHAGHGVEGNAHEHLLMVLRLVRLIRVARLVHELRIMLNSFLGAVQALAWIGVGMLVWFYMNACVTTVILGQPGELDPRDIRDAQLIQQKFKNIPESMFTLFELMTLDGWPLVVRPLFPKRPFTTAFFFFFISVSAFFLLNLVTAVVVDRTLVAQTETQASDETVKEDRREILINHLHAELTRKNGGADEILRSDFQKLLKDSEVCRLVTELGWSSSFLQTVVDLLDYSDNAVDDRVSLTKMSEAWQHFGKSLDAEHLLHFQVQMAQRLTHQERLIRTLLQALEKTSGHKFELSEDAGDHTGYLKTV